MVGFYCILFLSIYPGPYAAPQNFSVDIKTSNRVNFVWKPPAKPNGIIYSYQIQCSGGKNVVTQTVMGLYTEYLVSGFQPYTNYSCSITAHTSVGGGPATTISVVTEQDSELFNHSTYI